ncbi:hypothetical protein D9M72_449080 [compost metagenome]
MAVQQLAGADQDAHALVFQAGADVLGLLPRQAEQAVVDVLQVRAHHGGEIAAVDVELHSQLPRLADAGHQVRRRDQGFGRYDVGEHRRAAQARPLNDGDLRPQRGGHHGGFVAAGPSAEYCDAR